MAGWRRSKGLAEEAEETSAPSVLLKTVTLSWGGELPAPPVRELRRAA